MNEFQQNILEHYHNPKNFYSPVEWKPTSVNTLENASCGDKITIYIRVEDDIVKSISFTGEGCSIAIATASLLTEHFKDLHINEILSFKENNISTFLGIQLTINRLKCALLPLSTIKATLNK